MFNNFKFKKKKTHHAKGMTFIELIIVFSIFSVISGIVIFSYQQFQAKVDIKNLTNEIALKLVEAQKLSISGKLSTTFPYVTPWKPSYGVYFDATTPKSFLSFADLDNNDVCNDPGCQAPFSVGGEVIDIVGITRGSFISMIEPVGTGCPSTIQNLTVVFRRPDSSPIISSNPSLSCIPDYMAVTVTSLQGKAAKIKVYPSGRIQIN